MFTRNHVTLLSAATLLLVGGAAAASTVTLTSSTGNSSATFTDTGVQNSWTVGGISRLYDQSFWYRLDGATNNTPLSNISPPVIATGSTPGNNTIDQASYQYTSSIFSANVLYTLTDSSNGKKSDLAETIRLTNTDSRAHTVNFFEYVDFNLHGNQTPGGDHGQILAGGNTVVQWNNNVTISEAVVIPVPTTGAVSLASLLPSGYLDVTQNWGPVGPGNVNWVFQWKFNLGAGDTFLISKDKLTNVPVPAALWLFGSALVGLVGIAKRRNAGARTSS